jgi:nucleoside-diphosphate-sugar epimerase
LTAAPNSTHAREIILFGASGQIGGALARADSAQIHKMRWQEQGSDAWARQLNPVLSAKNCDLIFANGLTDPKLGEKALFEANLEFPKKIAALATRYPSTRFLTIGTIQENFPDLCASNPYLLSKLELGRWVESQFKIYPGRFIHVRLHTVYGSDVKPHMFLGQMISALRLETTFEMSSGDQLREYHHVDDIASSLTALLATEWSELGSTIDITSGDPLRLADLARAVFRASGRDDLLKIGSLPRASSENTEKRFPRSPEWLLRSSRDPLKGVVDFVKSSV